MENKKVGTGPNSRTMTLTIKAVVLNRKKEVLILKRAKDVKWNPGNYDLPGGHVENEELIADSIKREIKEETGLDAVFGDIIDVVEFPEGSQQFKDDKRGIRCICYSDSDEVTLSDEHETYEWVPLGKVHEKFSEKNGFENEKRETILKAQKYVEKEESLNGWKRCMADFENYKKRQLEEKKDLIAFANTNLILELIPVLDNFHASTDHVPEDQKENGWVTGIMYIQKQLEKVLSDNGANEIGINIGDEFNPETMEAIKQETGGDKEEKEPKERNNKVKKILQKGYKIDGKVIRAARVIVE